MQDNDVWDNLDLLDDFKPMGCEWYLRLEGIPDITLNHLKLD